MRDAPQDRSSPDPLTQRRLPGDLSPATPCSQCKDLSLHFNTVFPLGDYSEDLRRAVLLTKESPQRILSHRLAELLSQRYADDLLDFQPDLIAAIPMFWSQRIRRGVNNAEAIAESLARRLGVPYGRRLLIRRRNTEPQSTLSRSRRFENVHNAFRVSKCYRLQQTRIVLVDDILTTGATCSEATRMLRQAGAADIAVTVLAKSLRPDPS